MTFIDELAEKLAHQKASMIDASLARFLTEQGFETNEWNVKAMKKQLQDRGFEILTQVDGFNSELEIYTFKIVRVVAKSSFSVPQPHVTIGLNRNQPLDDRDVAPREEPEALEEVITHRSENEFEDEDTYKQERESERIDEYFAPSEGYVY
jgi:hypothetical protein